jgi:hypothetical protein
MISGSLCGSIISGGSTSLPPLSSRHRSVTRKKGPLAGIRQFFLRQDVIVSRMCASSLGLTGFGVGFAVCAKALVVKQSADHNTSTSLTRASPGRTDSAGGAPHKLLV